MLKNLFLLLILIIGFNVNATVYEADANIGTSRDHGYAAAKLVIAVGYTCTSISSIRYALTGGGYILSCNGYRYKYHIRDVGGRWKVTVE